MRLQILTWDGHNINDGVNYTAGFPKDTIFRLAKARPEVGERIGDFPLWTQKRLDGATLAIEILPLGTLHSQRDELAEWFDVYDTSGLKQLIVQDIADANRQWYIDADPIDFRPTGGEPSSYTIILLVPDPVWREVTQQTDQWNITATGQTRNITVRGNRPTPLRLRIIPTANKTTDFGFEHLVDVRNQNYFQLSQYPVDLTNGGWNTTGYVGATEMQSDGDDLRVFVDGMEVDRWLADINTNHTKVWINLDLEPAGEVVSAAAFNIGTTTLTYLEPLLAGRFPSRDGCFRIENEMVTYDVWDKRHNQFTGCHRGARGTTEANHAASTTVYKVEHHIQVMYGDSTLSAPVTHDVYKPIFDLSASTNASWVYTAFGSSPNRRSGRWEHGAAQNLQRLQTVDVYGGPHGATADPYTEMGLKLTKDNPLSPGDYWDHWYFKSQVDITNTSLEGDYKVDNAADVMGISLLDRPPNRHWRRMWGQFFTTNVAWTAWGPVVQAPRAGTRWLRLDVIRVIEGDASGDCYAEVQDATLTFDANQIPNISGPLTWTRVANPYRNKPTITNNTTGEYISLDFIQILAQTLRVDSEYHTVIYEHDSSNQYQALIDASSWEQWLMALPGINQLRITEGGVAGVTIHTYWRGRNS